VAHLHPARLREPAGLLDRFDRVLYGVIEAIVAFLVVVEVVILFAGVIWRYVLDLPLVWSGELAAILFLWLVSLGAVVALRRGEHMRMTFFVALLSPRLRDYVARISAMIVAVFTASILVPGIGFTMQQDAILTPTLQIPGSWEVAGQMVALALLLYTAIRQLFAGATPTELLVTAAFGLIVGFGLYFAEPALDWLGNGDLFVFFVVMVGICIFSGVPIAFSFGISTVAYIYYTSDIPLSVVVSQMDQGMASIELLAIPMFIVLGLLLEMTGIARALVDLLIALVGHRRGGLSYVLVGAIYLIAGISGSKAADQAAVAPILLPEMKRRGAHDGELVAQLAAAAAMSETIPPSLVLIILGAVTGVSISALFTGGLLPAGVAAVALIILIAYRSRHDKPTGHRVKWRAGLRLVVVAIPALILPVLIRYAVLEGITTATEVATVGVVYSVLVGLLVYRCFAWRRLMPILLETAALSGAILLIIGAASAMAWSLTQAGFAQTLAELMGSVPGGRAGFMAVSILLFIVLGSVLEGLPSLVLFGPLLFPLAQQQGINEVQYGIVAILAMGIGLFSPPFGVGFYQTCLIAKARSDDALGPIWPYMATLVVSLILVATIPWISTGFLPQ
jgi:tripartite ATP-independent transporter DctM subunit